MKDKRPDYATLMEHFATYVAEVRPQVQSPAEVAAVMRPLLHDREQEEMHVLLLDVKHRLIASERVTVGLVDRAPVHAREIFRRAILRNCSKILLVHNHPSGDPTPSAQDIASTRELVAAGKLLGIEVLDHVVLGQRTAERPRDYLSFREEALL